MYIFHIHTHENHIYILHYTHKYITLTKYIHLLYEKFCIFIPYQIHHVYTPNHLQGIQK
nr:hypothetical protein Itr_chr04CG17490 [Ipomoea trifida]